MEGDSPPAEWPWKGIPGAISEAQFRQRMIEGPPKECTQDFHVSNCVHQTTESLKDLKMADPFEIRMRFTTNLTHLSASSASAIKAAHYALKHRDQDEDLHSCIIEQLERNNMNSRANIMYFIETLCSIAGRPKDGHQMYVTMVGRDIDRIVDAVAPKDGSGAANVKVVKQVLSGLKDQGVVTEEKAEQLETGLKGRETRPEHLMGEDVLGDAIDTNMEAQIQNTTADIDDDVLVDNTTTITRPVTNKNNNPNLLAAAKTDINDIEMTNPSAAAQQQKPPSSTAIYTTTTNSSSAAGPNISGVLQVDKRSIEQRIEEDRERNKRLREGVWAVSGVDEEELNKMWEEGSEVGIDDLIMSGEEAAEREQAARYAAMVEE